MAAFDDFMKLDIRVGTITEAKTFEKARRPAYQLWVDLGEEIGVSIRCQREEIFEKMHRL